jgi:RimJ/RimL family protein N-acetyltransferase
MVAIRKARLIDLPLLTTLEKEFDRDQRQIVIKEIPKLKPYLRRTPEANRLVAKRIEKCLRSRNAFVLIAENNSEPVGFSTVSIERNHGWLPTRFGFIGYLFVKRQYRGQRISSLMVKAATAWLSKRNVRHLSLSVLAGNVPARAIYKKWGFHDYSIFTWKLR